MATGYLATSNDEGLQQMKQWANDTKADRQSKLTTNQNANNKPMPKSESSCKHAELISYKVHKDQFKSLLVPNRVCKALLKVKANPVVKNRKNSVLSGSLSHNHDARTFSSEVVTNESEGKASDSDSMSTDGEEQPDNYMSKGSDKQSFK
jgi:hypothetical protein